MPKPGDKREDGRIWKAGAWRTPEQIEARRLYDQKKSKEYFKNNKDKILARKRRNYWADSESRETTLEKRRMRYEENKECENAKRVERKRKNIERERETWKRWYRENQPEQFAKIIQRRKRDNPTYGLFGSISEYRRGRIGLDEIIRRCEDACSRADELCLDLTDKGRKPKGNVGGDGSSG